MSEPEIVVTGEKPPARSGGVQVYAPKMSVKLIKAEIRKELVDGLPLAAKRYADLPAIDLTPFLGDTGAVATSKGVREVAGGFNITFVDKPHAEKLETLYALIEPMDLVEIRFCHDPSTYGSDAKPPVVMRGFVTSVNRSEAMGGSGQPQRMITVAGQDMGKVLDIFQIFYLNNSGVGDNILSELQFFQKYAEMGDAKEKTAVAFLNDIVEKVLNPYLKKLVALARGESVGAKVIDEWTVKANVEGCVSPYAVNSFVNVSLADMLEALFDVGPFNELYTEDTEDGVQLVLRPAPFLDVKGQPIQKVVPEEIEIDLVDVLSEGVTRSDAGVANYFWVSDTRWMLMSNEDHMMVAQTGSEKDFILFEYPNSKASRYGVRKMEVGTMLGPAGYSNSDEISAEQQPAQNDALTAWIDKRRKVLADSNKDNVLFESGTLTVRGNEKIKAGMQLRLKRGGGRVSTFYVVRIDHQYRPFDSFTSRLTVERGTTFIERAQAEEALYYPEIT